MLVLQQFLKSSHVELVDNFAVVAFLFQILPVTVKLVHLGEQTALEGFALRLMDVNVVDPDAGLSTVEELAEKQSVQGDVDLRSLVDHHGALAAQFEDAGDQVLGCLLRHQFASHC